MSKEKKIAMLQHMVCRLQKHWLHLWTKRQWMAPEDSCFAVGSWVQWEVSFLKVIELATICIDCYESISSHLCSAYNAETNMRQKLCCLFSALYNYRQRKREKNRRYYQKLKQDPERYKRVMKRIDLRELPWLNNCEMNMLRYNFSRRRNRRTKYGGGGGSRSEYSFACCTCWQLLTT